MPQAPGLGHFIRQGTIGRPRGTRPVAAPVEAPALPSGWLPTGCCWCSTTIRAWASRQRWLCGRLLPPAGVSTLVTSYSYLRITPGRAPPPSPVAKGRSSRVRGCATMLAGLPLADPATPLGIANSWMALGSPRTAGAQVKPTDAEQGGYEVLGPYNRALPLCALCFAQPDGPWPAPRHLVGFVQFPLWGRFSN